MVSVSHLPLWFLISYGYWKKSCKYILLATKFIVFLNTVDVYTHE